MTGNAATSSRPRGTGRRRGLALIDTVLVILLTGIFVAAAAPRYADAVSRLSVRAAAERVQADLQSARRTAIARSTPVTVTFSTDTNSYSIPALPGLRTPSETYAVDLSDEPYAVTLLSASFGGDPAVIFNEHGVPDTGGVIDVQRGSYRRSVTVQAESGAVTTP